jgi:MFS family permease
MFILVGLVLGVVLAVMLGGSPRRVTEVRFRHVWIVFAALGLQAALLVPPHPAVGTSVEQPLYLASHGLLVAFALANLRMWSLIPISLGMLMNTIAIAANGGRMPVSESAAAAAGIDAGESGNVGLDADRFQYLGDVFALPSGAPLANVFSVGDLLIAAGAAGFIAFRSLDPGAGAAVAARRLLKPLRERSYRRLAAGSLVSRVGDWLTLAALIGWLYRETGSTGHVAALILVRLAPPILGSGLAAMVVDRLPKTRLLVGVELARALTIAGAVYGVLSHSLPAVFAALAASGLLAAVSNSIVPALVPAILDDDRLPAANAGLGVAQDIALAFGALLAGVALSTTDVIVALIIDALTFGVAALLYLGVKVRSGSATEQKSEQRSSGALAGLRYVIRRRSLVTVILAFGVATIATGLTNATLPSFLEDLGLGSSSGYGFGLAALGAGLVLGQAMTCFVRIGPGGIRWMPCALALMAAVFAGLAYTEHALTALLLLGVIGFLDGTTDVLFDTVVQREVDARYLGRVFGLGSAFFMTTMMAAVGAAPVVHTLVAPDQVLLFAGAFVLAAGVVAALGASPPRRAKATGLERPLEVPHSPAPARSYPPHAA